MKYSIVIPIKDEEENIPLLVREVEEVMGLLGEPWEMICIDDGSQDASLDVLKELASQKAFLRLIVFEKNYGQTSGFDAGFKAAEGEYLITLDADLQNDPSHGKLGVRTQST
ncbi:glycosyltransferase [Simkania negevensis]|uniref:Glycosyltransferase n=1 Tax=Simkania negevensis TaxID=83561 RepID=A0ABS3ASW3_9BACT|nr:glycosyltransferase [Simkania negevensis]